MSYLSVNHLNPPPSPTASSLGGDTLGGESSRSRTNSFNTNRTRTNSTAQTEIEKPDFDDFSAEEALRPGKGQEKDFKIENNSFGVTPGELNKLQNPKSLPVYRALGGLRGIERALRTDISSGLSVDETRLQGTFSLSEATKGKFTGASTMQSIPQREEVSAGREIKDQFHDRIRVFKDNRLPDRKADSIWVLLWKAYNDKILILLTAAAVISLALGLYETFSGGSSVDWVEGVAICVAIIVVVLVTAANDWQKERQFVKLNKRKEDREVKAIRSGKSVMISVYDVMVGDVLYLEPGDAIPADGIFISGHGVKCDESSATGESDQMKKTAGEEVWQQLIDGTATRKLDPFIISGSKVLEGVGTFLVTSVGVNSSYGKILVSLQVASESTPLQVKLAGLADWIGGLGSAAAGLLFIILVIRFLANLSGNPATPAVKGQQFLDILIVAVTIIVVAVPEGLPLAVTLALAFATTRMLKENNLVRVLRACETMGNATTICSDKTGTLTQNKMTVVAGALGLDQKFAQPSSLEKDSTTASFADVFRKLTTPFKELLTQSIAVNSTAFEGEENGQKTFVGSKTETALLVMAGDHLALANVAEERSNAEIVQLIPFDSARKCMGAVIRLPSGGYRMVVKGAAELMLAKADSVVSGLYDDEFVVDNLSVEGKKHIASHIYAYAEKSLRTIGFLYKDFARWPPTGARSLEGDKNTANFDDIFTTTMTWIGVVGIQDPLRPQVTDAVRRCQMAGIKVRMVTGDNQTTANAIAIECGIKTRNGIVMEGPVFRQLSDKQMDAEIPKLDVLARSSPEDKRILVERLKKLGETVAVTGDGTNDGPALKTADVGFSMGIAGTEVAKEASEIILMDDNFASIVKAVMWGRSVNDAVAKFLQFQITVNISAVILAFVSAVSNSDNHSVLTAVQLLWVNLVMDTFAALALATDAPTDKILDRKPVPKSAPLITIRMWKMIIGQAIYQLVVTFTLYFAGTQILNYNTDLYPKLRDELNTMVFNTFVWMQIFNEFNNRRLDNKFNIFEGVHKNWFFIGINCIMVGGQILIVFVGGRAFQITKIDGTQWAICILSALPCLLWAVVLRIMPDRWAEVVFMAVIKAFLFVFAPMWKVVRIVFHPVGKAWRAVVAPVKRFSTRMWTKTFGKKKEGGAERADEEAMSSGPEKPTTPTSPLTNLPPITLTTPDQDDQKS